VATSWDAQTHPAGSPTSDTFATAPKAELREFLKSRRDRL
jgi:hypothetical protein